ncbi:MAG: pantoate--beta-alanine ligase [Brachybacterium sp.]|nr:pantoate--beta-alanine ligase [Brachybacterium sp.]
MTILTRNRDQLRSAREALEGTVALVPTMGALHDGHLALVDRARSLADHVIVSIFVNPLQFGPGEDFEAYPRDLDADLAVLGDRADVVFAPATEDMYPQLPPAITVDVGILGTVHEGARRPGHFAGVATVVLKLLHLARPDIAVFGEKDAQQLLLIRRMVADLDVPVQIEAVALQREPSGLARSSRNTYLSAEGREQALLLAGTIASVEDAAPSAAAVLEALAVATTVAPDGVAWDYALALDPLTLQEITAEHAGEAVVVLAARIEGTRLLDTTTVRVGDPGPSTSPPDVADATPPDPPGTGTAHEA